MSDNIMLFLVRDELIALILLADKGFEALIREYPAVNGPDIRWLSKCGALIHKIGEESEKHTAKHQSVPIAAAAELVGGESDAR